MALGVFVALRALAILVADLPTVMPDEYGSWAIATRLTLGDGALSMQDMPSYPLVPGLVLVPLQWMPVAPSTAYRLSIVLTSAMVLLAAQLLRRSVRRLRPGEPLLAAAAFALVLLFPALVTTTAFTWAEPSVVLCWAGIVWASVELTHRSMPAAGRLPVAALVVGSLAAGAAPFVHGRLMFAPIIWVGLVIVGANRLRTTPMPGAPPIDRAAALAVCGTLVTSFLLWRVDGAVRASLWVEATGHDTSVFREAWSSGELWWTALAAVVGQLWYGVVASAGLAAFGVVALVAVLRGRHGPEARLVGLVVAALATTNLALSTIAMTAGTYRAGSTGSTGGVDGSLRWDHLVYGRYNDAAIIVLAIIGLMWLWSLRSRVLATWATISVFTLAAVATVTVRAGQLPVDGRVDLNIAAVSAISAGKGATALMVWTAIGLAAMSTLVYCSTLGQRQLALAVVVVSCLLAVPAGLRTAELQRSHSTPDIAAEVGAPGGQNVAALASDTAALPYLRLGALGLQHQLVAEGWTFEFSDSPSRVLARDANDRFDLGIIVVDEGDRPGPGWSMVLEFQGSTMWRRS